MAEKHKRAHIFPSFNNKSYNFYSNRRIGVLLSFISFFLLGLLPIISVSRPSTLDALTFAFYLSLWELICSLPLFSYELTKNDKGIFHKSINPKVRKRSYLIMGITGSIFTFSTFFYVYAFETAGTISAAIAIQTYPLFSILMEFIIFKKKKQLLELLFTSTVIVGIYYLGTGGTWLITGFSPWFALALIVPFLWSIAHVTIKHTLDNSPITPNQVTFFRVLISSIFLFGLSILIRGTNYVFEGFLKPEFQIFGFLMGLVYYLELVNWFYAIKHVEVSMASTITTPNPIITLILAVFLLRDSIELYQVIAMIIVFASLYGLIWSGKANHQKK